MSPLCPFFISSRVRRKRDRGVGLRSTETDEWMVYSFLKQSVRDCCSSLVLTDIVWENVPWLRCETVLFAVWQLFRERYVHCAERHLCLLAFCCLLSPICPDKGRCSRLPMLIHIICQGSPLPTPQTHGHMHKCHRTHAAPVHAHTHTQTRTLAHTLTHIHVVVRTYSIILKCSINKGF